MMPPMKPKTTPKVLIESREVRKIHHKTTEILKHRIGLRLNHKPIKQIVLARIEMHSIKIEKVEIKQE